MRKRVVCTILLVSFMLGCVTTQKTPQPKTTEEVVTEASFADEAARLIDAPAPSAFLALININKWRFPEQSSALLAKYAEKERALATHYETEHDYILARFHFNNLLALTEVSEKEEDDYYSRLSGELEEEKMFASSRYLRTILKEKLRREDYSPPSSLSKYNALLAEIHIDRSYESNAGLMRRNFSTFAGSGFLVDTTHVLTAYHVIEEVFLRNTITYRIDVRIQNKLIKNVTLLQWDSLSDLAVLTLGESVDMPYDFYRLLGDSSRLRQGFEIYCLGNHAGFTSTLTKGIISSAKRKAPESGYWLQVDAPVAPGASGGLVIGRDRLVYGMIVAGLLYQDINFVVPSNLILEVIDSLLAGRNVRRPWLGFILGTENGSPDSVEIIHVFPSSPVDRMLVGPGNMIVEINGRKVGSVEEAQQRIYGLEAGNIVRLGVKNIIGEKKIFHFVLGRRPDYAILNAITTYDRISSLYPQFGFEVEAKPVRSETQTIRGEKYTIDFHRVVRVIPDSFLDCRGVRTGDLLGFLADYYENRTRYIELLHVSPDHPFKELRDVFENIYYLKKDKYDENIL
jgi:S1-C subfamily serine protease